jgi:hypothetical protein
MDGEVARDFYSNGMCAVGLPGQEKKHVLVMQSLTQRLGRLNADNLTKTEKVS